MLHNSTKRCARLMSRNFADSSCTKKSLFAKQSVFECEANLAAKVKKQQKTFLTSSCHIKITEEAQCVSFCFWSRKGDMLRSNINSVFSFWEIWFMMLRSIILIWKWYFSETRHIYCMFLTEKVKLILVSQLWYLKRSYIDRFKSWSTHCS